MPTSLTDADKVIRNDTGLEIAAAIRELAAPEADRVGYDNTSSGLTADNAQDAIDELKTKNDTKMDAANPTGTGSLSIGRKSGTATGLQSVAVGYNTTASGSRSHAEGEGTTASGSWSHAENINTKASGDRSHCEGYQTEATRRSQHVFGEFNTKDTSGADSTAKGTYIEIVGNGTNNENRSNARTLDWSGNEVLAGDLTINGSTSVGSTLGAKMDKANPTGTGSLSINRASGSTVGANSVAVGNGNTASGESSFAEGRETTASGIRAHAEGSATTASGDYSHAEGAGSTSSGERSHAEGSGTTASGTYSHAEGSGTKASGNNGSHAEGYNTVSSGAYGCHAEGNGTIANHVAQHVFGAYNVADASTAPSTARGNYVEIVGKGGSSSNRSNARTLDWNGNETLAGGLKLHENQDAATLNVSSSIAAGATYDFTNYSDETVIFVYRPADAGQSDYTGIYIREGNWQRLIPIKEAPNVTTSGYVLTNGNSQALRCVILST